MSLRVSVCAALCALSLSACGHVPVSTMYQLRKFDPATFDPAQLRVAMRVSDAIAPRPDSVRLRLVATLAGQGERKMDVVLLSVNKPEEVAPLGPFRQEGAKLHLYRVNELDVARIRALQAEGIAARSRNPGNNGLTLAVDMDSCRWGALPDGAIYSTTLVRVDPAQGYLVLLKDVDLRKELTKLGKSIDDAIPPCAG